MNIEEMKMADVEARRAEIATRRAEIDAELQTAEAEALDALEEEVRGLNDEEEELEKRAAAIQHAAEERAAQVREVINTGKESRKITTEEKNTMEVRNTPEYKKAFAKSLITGDDSECRALLSTNATTGGQVPVPDYVGEKIRTAWENDEIMGRVNKSYLKGNVKIGFEASATGAVVHVEGSDAPDEQTVTMGIVDLTAQSVKKWITVSTEAIDQNEDVVDYVYDELTYHIVKAAAAILIGKIKALPAASTDTAPAAAKITTAPTLTAVANGIANLSDTASDPVVIINKLTYADFKAAQAAGGFNYDPFEGRPVVFCNTLKAYSAAATGEVYGIVGDLRVGAQANFPAGDDVKIVRDEYSMAEQDLVKFVGRQLVGIGAVAPFAFALLAKPTTT